MSVHSALGDQASPSLFEGINARYYRASEIAKSFVPNEQFENLIVRQHTLVVGPRGSGKTTLLRMLHPDCLRVWNHVDAETYRRRVDFSAAYVATDRVWRQQVEGAIGQAAEDVKDAFFGRIIALDVMAAMLRTVEIRVERGIGESGGHRYAPITDDSLAALVSELAEGWKLDPKFLNLGSLRVAIRRRRIESRSQLLGGALTDPDNFSGMSWDEAALLAIDAFESATGVRDELWALLFDELEIVPSRIRDSILGSTRGMDRRLILKCSLSPWLTEQSSNSSHYDGTVFNDFNVLKLFYGRRTESYEFSRQLILGRIKAVVDLPKQGAVEDLVFGRSNFSGDDIDGHPSRTAAAYRDDSPLGKVVKELAEIDVKFRAWLRDQGISHDRLDQLSEKKRAETLRKARNIIIARLEFRRASGLLRSRKTMAMYAGGATMLDICEGNPRLLLGLLLPLLDYFDGKHPIPRQLQADLLNQIADDFYALIDALPVSEVTQQVPEMGRRAVKSPYREFVDRVSKFFQDSILRGDFNPQPPSTFRIPKVASRGLQLIVGRLVNMGALVIVPDRGIKDVLIGEFDSHRLRLCYLIAAREHLPPNIDRPISVHRILGSETTSSSLPGLGVDEI